MFFCNGKLFNVTKWPRRGSLDCPSTVAGWPVGGIACSRLRTNRSVLIAAQIAQHEAVMWPHTLLTSQPPPSSPHHLRTSTPSHLLYLETSLPHRLLAANMRDETAICSNLWQLALSERGGGGHQQIFQTLKYSPSRNSSVVPPVADCTTVVCTANSGAQTRRQNRNTAEI